MSTFNIITVKAAAKIVPKTNHGFVMLSDLKELMTANQPKSHDRPWAFLGSKADWNRCVQPYFK